MDPKWSQNLSKIDPGGVWRPLGSHPWNKMLPRLHFWWFWLHFETPFGTSLRSFWASCFWCLFEVAFWWPWPPFGLPKHLQMKPKRVPTPKAEIHRCCLYFLHFSHIQGCWKSSFFEAFLEPSFGMAFGTHFCDFGSFGFPFGDHFGHFLDTIFASIFRPPQNIEKWAQRGRRPCL